MATRSQEEPASPGVPRKTDEDQSTRARYGNFSKAPKAGSLGKLGRAPHLDAFASPQRFEESNGFGNKSCMRITSVFPFRFARITGTSPQNSQMSWRQAPQGGVSVSVSVTTEIASKPRSPSLMALKMATRYAHTVKP